MNPTYILVTDKTFHDSLYENFINKNKGTWIRIKKREELSFETLKKLDPDWIFIPHWSYIIPNKIFNSFRCVVFHMTDLPYGRGGSPLQNLIVEGKDTTMISAIKVTEGLDTGDVYLKKPLSLTGSAQEIFIKASLVIEEMIEIIINNNPVPEPQKGDVTFFKRRKPEQSNLKNLSSLNEVYDYIRMLDCEGYPYAYLETEYFRFEFTNAKQNKNQSIEANVRIIKK